MKDHKDLHKPIEKVKLKDLSLDDSKAYHKVICPSCKDSINVANIELKTEMGKCNSCNVIFSISDEIKNVKQEKEKRQEFLRPDGIDLFFFKDEMDITIRDHMGGEEWGIHLLVHAITGGLALNYFAADNPLSPYFVIIAALLSIYFMYKAAVFTKNNKTFIDINSETLNIKSRPKRILRQDKTYSSSDIDQVYLKHDPNGGAHIQVVLIVNHIDGIKHENLCIVSNLAKAKYLEQEIENYLKIKDRKVPEATR